MGIVTALSCAAGVLSMPVLSVVEWGRVSEAREGRRAVTISTQPSLPTFLLRRILGWHSWRVRTLGEWGLSSKFFIKIEAIMTPAESHLP